MPLPSAWMKKMVAAGVSHSGGIFHSAALRTKMIVLKGQVLR